MISVVIPVFNGEKTIEAAVRSVLAQTLVDFELIVIDDGSQDATLGALVDIKDPRVRIFSYPNSGPSASRNRGIAHARGKFISFLDADDLWTSEKLRAQLKALMDNPEAAVSYSWTEFIDGSGARLGQGIYCSISGYVLPSLLNFFFIGSGSNALIRASVFDEVGGFDEEIKGAEDMDLFYRLASRYPFVAVQATHVLYRISGDSISSDIMRQERVCLTVIERVFASESGTSLHHLKGTSIANLYLYLTGRALRDPPNRQNGLIASRFLGRAIKNDPFVLKQAKYVVTLLSKIVTAVALPPQHAVRLRAAMKASLPRR